jgi:hypothetical protein
MANSFLDTLLNSATSFLSSNGKDKEIQVEIPLGEDEESKEMVMAIAKSELLKGRDQQYPLDYTQTVSDNLDRLLIPLNNIRNAYGKPMIVNSGWRPPSINANTPGAAPQSKHMLGLAADISDPDGALWAWVLENLQLMKNNDIFMEDKRWTPGWVHFGLGKPASGHRIFVPSATRAPDPNAWDGQYDSNFDV